jgi:heme A synthase
LEDEHAVLGPTSRTPLSMNALFHAHSGLRYLVLLAALGALIVLGYSLATGRASRAARVVPMLFTGLLDLQITLGIVLVMGGLMPDAVVGHLALMLLAATVVHGSAIMAKRAADDRRELVIRLAGVALTVVLIVGGILAIGRGVFGSAPPTAG